MRFLKFLLAAFLFIQGVAAQCGPPQCYNGCTDARPQVDFVFLIDQSGSMQPKIDGVKKGLTTFAQSLDGNQISPKFAIVLFGNTNPSLRLQMSDFGAFKTSMDGIRTDGLREPGLEAMSTALNIAAQGNLNINYRSGQNTKKVFIVVTNEDSDQSTRSANIQFTGSLTQSGADINGWCYGDFATNDWASVVINQATWDGAWQKEVDLVANKLISSDASVYMFVGWTKSLNTWDVGKSQTCKTPYQYCNPDRQSQSSDYKDFNATLTLTSLRSPTTPQDKSLQGRLLTAGKTARCFDVADTASSTLVNNFFSQIVSDVSKCDSCYAYRCSGSNCLAPTYICDCEGVPNGPKRKDSLGNCCIPEYRDCAGICNGTAKYDACGVCTPNGALYPACKLDCNSTRYLDLPPEPNKYTAYSSLIYKTDCPNIAGYLLPNADLITHYKTMGTTASICAHFHTNGRFEGRTQCVLDAARYANDYAVNPANAEADWLTRLLSASPRTAYCTQGSRFKIPSTPNQCGQCVTNLDSPPYCVQDCSGAWRKQADAPHFTDNCGFCVPAGTNASARFDDCGICDGGNAAKNECDECFGVRGKDGCNNFLCKNISCNLECDGELRDVPQKELDICGYCVNITDVRDPRCVQDCAGAWYRNESLTSSPSIIDECGNCVTRTTGRLATCTQDCSGAWGGSAYEDECGQCVVNGVPPRPCKKDCAGVTYREGLDPIINQLDDCGKCRNSTTRNDDKDACGVCRSKSGYDSAAECTPDCKGIYHLVNSPDRAFRDFCGDCWFANQTELTNYYMDACGLCFDSRDDPNWNKTTNSADSQGQPCKCGTSPVPCPNNATITTCTDSCPEFNFCNGTQTPPDFCGRCPPSPYFNQDKDDKDDCGLCCDPTAGVPCNQDKDDCGECFGFNRKKKNPCGICLEDPAVQCVRDCLGVYGGNATLGCDGICNSNAVCAYCGNGDIEPGEACDNGHDAFNVSLNVAGSGCTPSCTAERGSNTGSIIGGVIGGVAAVAFLGLAAFMAVKYAQKAGLIGSANKQVDMGASNSNPLYKSEVAVHQNPLYGN